MRAQGEWTQAGAPAVLAMANDYVQAGSIDLSTITRIDSTAVALLLELSRRAQSQGKTLRFTAAPAKLMTLVGFFEVDSMLSIQG